MKQPKLTGKQREILRRSVVIGNAFEKGCLDISSITYWDECLLEAFLAGVASARELKGRVDSGSGDRRPSVLDHRRPDGR